ncbi:MAG TPA: phosphoribosyltransferase family protein [Candidatus Saccharimonadales bacterium]|nr:phosphoribosyltransferase family protein [Candidatus Saccharimonadales bacterium]
MYFTNRAQAGEALTEELQDYRYKNCVVVALTDGAVLVAEPIAHYLHATLAMLLAEQVEIPGEHQYVGTVNQDGGYAENSEISEGEMDEYKTEFFNYIEEEKLRVFQKLNRLVTDGGAVDPAMLQDHDVILVSDGLKTGATLDAAAEFLKPIRLHRLVIATPLASVGAVDRMHVLADELHCLNVVDNYLDTNHYYDNNKLPNHKQILAKIRQSVLNWK